MTFCFELWFQNFQKQTNKQTNKQKQTKWCFFQTVIKQPIIDGFQILTCLKKCFNILLWTSILKFSKTNKQTNNQTNNITKTVINWPILDGFQMSRCLKRHFNILLELLFQNFNKQTNKQTKWLYLQKIEYIHGMVVCIHVKVVLCYYVYKVRLHLDVIWDRNHYILCLQLQQSSSMLQEIYFWSYD